MPKFGEQSRARLATCHEDLQRLFGRVVEIVDCTVICGHRGEAEQAAAVAAGKSKKTFPSSLHNRAPALAVDVAPYPVNWSDTKGFIHFAGIVRGVAAALGIAVRWGGDWDGDFDLKDNTFNDLPHFELVGKDK